MEQEKKARSQAKKRNKIARGGKVGRPRKMSPDELRRGVEAYFASISYMEPVMREEYIVLKKDPETGAVEFVLDKMGHRAVRQVPVLGANGKPLMRTVYIEAPGDFGLCNYLKISRDTWDRYGRAVELLEERRQQSRQFAGAMDCGERCSPLHGDQCSPLHGDQWSPLRGERGDAGQSDDGSQIGAANQKTVPVIDEELQEAREYAEIYTLARGRVCAYLESAAETRGGKGAQFKLERIYGLGEKKEVRLDAAGSIEAFLRGMDEE